MVSPIQLTNMGIQNKSMSSALGESGGSNINPALEQALAESKQLKSPAARALALENALAQAQQAEAPSTLDKLKSPRGILSLLLAGGAAAAGAPALGVGMGLGTLSGADLLAREAKQAQMETVEDLQDRVEKAYTRVDNQQQRMVSAFQSMPEAFAGIAPEDLGQLMFGIEAPVDPVMRYRQKKQDERWNKQWDLFLGQMETATTPQRRSNILAGIEGLLGYALPPDLRQAITSNVQGTDYLEDVNKKIVDMALDPRTGLTGLRALNAAFMEGRENQLWTILPQIQWTEEDETGRFSESEATWKLIERMNEWWQDPNVDPELKLSTGGDPEKIADIVFENEVGFKGVMQKKFGDSGLTVADAFRIYQGANSELVKFGQFQDLGEILTGSPEDRANILRNNTNTTIGQMQQVVEDNAMSAQAEIQVQGSNILRDGTGNRFLPGVYLRVAGEDMRAALEAATNPETGDIDQAAFERLFSQNLAESIAQMKALMEGNQ